MRPFYIDDFDPLRAKLERAERNATLMGRVWASVRLRARSAPAAFPWFTPFVAMVARDARDVEAARAAIRNYVGVFESLSYSMGLHFHFWCYAFPHARWALYFQWLDSMGAWDAEEARRLREAFVAFQFVNFFYGVRTKPEPECVDNQTMALCYSNALVGQLFAEGAEPSAMAARMRREGVRRLPPMLGGMPPSGYSGEGSTYMDHVMGPAIPFVTEFLERVEGGDWFNRALGPNGGSAATVVRMIAREWTPAGLTLPWDHYGYSLPTRSCIAYGALRTGDPLYLELLERHASWTHDVSVGWGYDDLVWSLVWWPETQAPPARCAFRSWAAEDVGAALVSDDASLYLMQMWDASAAGCPTRAHVNPNAVVLCAHGSPLTVDGVPAKGCTAFQYDDAWRDLSNMDFNTVRSNFGSGCAGAHSVLIVDGWEAMRATADYEQARMLAFDGAGRSVAADVTAIYRERWPDTIAVRRRSRLCEDRFWLIEDLAAFGREHDVDARWFLRPALLPGEAGVRIETAEGVRLALVPLLGPAACTARTVAGYPDRLDGESVQVDFRQRGARCRWLWLAWPDATRAEAADVSADWQALADPHGRDEFVDSIASLRASALRLPFTMPAFMLAEQPVVRRWWYRRTLRMPAAGPCWLRLPHGMLAPRLWVDGREVDLTPHILRMALLEPEVALETAPGAAIEVVVRVDCGVSQYGANDAGGSGFSGRPALRVRREPEAILDAAWQNGAVVVRTAAREWRVEHRLLEAE